MDRFIDMLLNSLEGWVKVVVSIIILGCYLYINFRQYITLPNQVLHNRYLKFRAIRKEYKKDQINGYFALQSFLKLRVTQKEMDYIFNSPDAYKIIYTLKGLSINYKFEDDHFIFGKKKIEYIFPGIGFLIFSFPIIYYFLDIVNVITTHGILFYLIRIVLLSVIFGPISYINIKWINDLSKAFFLEKIAINKSKKEQKEKGKKNKKI